MRMELATDIQLCSVTDVKAKEKLMNALMKAGVPYAEKWEKVSLRKRKQYNRAKEVCVIITHKAQADLARAVIESMGEDVKGNIVW
jgi:hypothetical protein